MNLEKKLIVTVLACIVLSSALGLSSYLYFDLDEKHTRLQSDYDSLVTQYNLLNNTHSVLVYNYTQLNETHQILILEHNELNASYRILVSNYTELKQDYSNLSGDYTTLEHNYTDLSNDYAVLQGQYASLFSDYNALSQAFNDPLPYEETPLTYELKEWLATDETDEIRYTIPNFVCGDFAVMLSLHAKLKHWDMGVVGVIGHTRSLESFAHAFNAIICGEGLVYVEPQTDRVWWYEEDHIEITEGNWWEFPNFGDIYVEECIIILWYD